MSIEIESIKFTTRSLMSGFLPAPNYFFCPGTQNDGFKALRSIQKVTQNTLLTIDLAQIKTDVAKDILGVKIAPAVFVELIQNTLLSHETLGNIHKFIINSSSAIYISLTRILLNWQVNK